MKEGCLKEEEGRHRMSHDEKRILSQEHEMMPKSVTTATLMERQGSTMTTCETVISVEDSSNSSPTATLRSSKVTTVTEEATIFDISSNTLSSHSITDEEEEEHQVDGTYSKSTIR